MNTPEEMDAEVRESWRTRIAAVSAETVNEKDRDGRGWLSNAIVWLPDTEAIQRLLDLGADVNAADLRRWTPLHFAAQERHAEIASLLIQKGAAVDPTDKFGNTPLGNATYGQDCLDVMRVLVDAGANPDQKNDYGISPLDLAKQTGDAEKLAILEAGPKTAETHSVESSETHSEESEPERPEIEQAVSTAPEVTPNPAEDEPLAVALSEQAASEDFFEIPHVDEQQEFLAEEEEAQPPAVESEPVLEEFPEPTATEEEEQDSAAVSSHGEESLESAVPVQEDRPLAAASAVVIEESLEPTTTGDEPLAVTPNSIVEEKLEPAAPEQDNQPIAMKADPVVEEPPQPPAAETAPALGLETHSPEPDSIDEQQEERSPPKPVTDLEPAPPMAEAPPIGSSDPALDAPPSGEPEEQAPFERFQKRFQLDPDGGQRAPITASMPNVGLKELLSRFAGASFNNGLYRIIDAQTVVEANAFIATAFPEDVGKLCPFAFDWAGNIFAVDPRDPEGEVVLYDLGTSDVATMPLTVLPFHDDHLPQDSDDGVLSSQLYGQWLSSGGQAPTYLQCVEFKVPLFLNGSHDLQNMAITDLEVYWHLTAQLIQQARALSPGARIGTVAISD